MDVFVASPLSSSGKPGRQGGYRVAAASGLLTTVAAATGTAGHIFAMRWAPGTATPTQFCIVTRFRARWVTVAGFTGAQEVGMDLIIARSFSASYTGGTAMTLTTPSNQKRTSFPGSQMADMRIGTTGALTAGTQTLDSQPIAQCSFSELAAGAAVPKGFMEINLDTQDLDRYPVVLAPNEGLVLRNDILMGGGGTARVIVEVDWLELERY